MAFEFSNMKVIGDFDMNNFSGRVGTKTHSGIKRDLEESNWNRV